MGPISFYNRFEFFCYCGLDIMMETVPPTPTAEERKVVQEFGDLLEASKNLFNGLRDLPQYGQRQWQPYFARTFETYTKLWKFQQENRLVLDSVYGLKRWQIGEIASKIGQLYYHYYLRTSEANYLNEAYHFYSAIRTRNYYKNAHKEESCSDLLLKKHRYYARFIVVCLLLDYKQDVYNLVMDFSKQVEEQKQNLENNGQEWTQVVSEIKAFLDAEPVEVLKAETYQKCDLSMRLCPGILPPPEKGVQAHVTLGDAIIVGNSPSQLKFSELTIDMFRMIQVLERKPVSPKDSQKNDKTIPTNENGKTQLKRDNPHKYLLYRPTFYQLFTFVSTAVKELPPGQALLLYISAHGTKPNRPQDPGGYEYGGVITNDRKDEGNVLTKLSPKKTSTLIKNMHCLHPGDLIPFTRKPLLIIIDSDNSRSFAEMPNYFGQPFICLMSPEELPAAMKDNFENGRLLTLFLYSPVFAFMQVCGVNQTSDRVYETCSQVVHKALDESQRAYLRSRILDHGYLQIFGDDFLRLILLRFVFCFCVLRLHRAFKDDSYYPSSHPELPTEDFVGNPAINKAIVDMADVLGVRTLFLDADGR
uniref:protein SCAI-like n=1 Tax=Styela clava TaxID=7725 RepID=UPI00193ABA13|nr:protein SCAI-like [Styela clava]